MKRLSELIPGCGFDTEIRGISIDSRSTKPGDLFVCVSGATADRHAFVPAAVKNGAAAVIASRPVETGVPVVYVEDTNRALAELARSLTDHPEREMHMTAVTGTNGKTTVATLISQLYGEDRCGRIGTNGVACAAFSFPIRNTCPDADRLYPYLRQLRDAGCDSTVLEASSEALAAGRLDGLPFDTVIFTNITRDHLNTHGTIENYIRAKLLLLELVKPEGLAVLNADDPPFRREAEAAPCRVFSYGKAADADLRIRESRFTGHGTEIVWQYEGKEYPCLSPMAGSFNVYNLTAAAAALLGRGLSLPEIIDRFGRIRPVPGRAELLSYGQAFRVVLDYAHTPDALRQIYGLLEEVREADLREKGRTGRILTVVGSAGGRDRDKRGEMGEICLSSSELVYFTMDDPRTESVDAIIDDLVGDGQKKNFLRINDREEAIFTALSEAGPDDIVLVTGKGRDNYMALGTEYLPYSDEEVIRAFFCRH